MTKDELLNFLRPFVGEVEIVFEDDAGRQLSLTAGYGLLQDSETGEACVILEESV